MNIRLQRLQVTTRQSLEEVTFSRAITFLHGPVGTGKSSVARLVDFCLGGRLERTPAIQLEFVAARLYAVLGGHDRQFERTSSDPSHVRVTWERGQEMGSVNAPLEATATPIIGDNVFNLSDVVFWLCGLEPIKVRKSKQDDESKLVRLSIRDLLWYCYLKQERLDSSFYRLEDTYKRYKSMDAMRFVTGLYSERLNELEARLGSAQESQRTKREAVVQIRRFLKEFDLATEVDLDMQLQQLNVELDAARRGRTELEQQHSSRTHVTEPMRIRLRELGQEIEVRRAALADLYQRIRDQESLRSELITAKVKAARVESASTLLAGVRFEKCPCCGTKVTSDRFAPTQACYLCGQNEEPPQAAAQTEALQRDLNSRIDDLEDAIGRHRREVTRGERAVGRLLTTKADLDQELTAELVKYDSAFVSVVREADRSVATLQERITAMQRMARFPAAIQELERDAGNLQGEIDIVRSAIKAERERLQHADVNITAIEDTFFKIMRTVTFPGVDENDRVEINPRNWLPRVIHGEDGQVEWSFFDAGSGGKKTLFNVCYALAVHQVALENGLPLPTFLMVDSPTKNISRDINREMVSALYRYAYELADPNGLGLQLIVIDSVLVAPEDSGVPFSSRLMNHGDPHNPPLISYYIGP